VENMNQYNFILRRSISDQLDLIVYSGGKYRAIHATAPERRFGIIMKDYGH